jgi:hypothetical protein
MEGMPIEMHLQLGPHLHRHLLATVSVSVDALLQLRAPKSATRGRRAGSIEPLVVGRASFDTAV